MSEQLHTMLPHRQHQAAIRWP